MAQGDAGLLLVDGDPGIGKTRLVGHLARAVEDEGTLVLWGRCDEEPVAPFQPFAEALGRYFHAESADRISTHARLAARRALPSRPAPARVRAGVRSRIRASPRTTRFRFFEAVTATLGELSDNGTLLLVVDDLHWADQPTLLLMRHVLRNIDQANLGIVGMYIDTEVPADHRLRAALADFRSDHSVETVHLQGLNEDGVEELVRGWPRAPADLVPRLCKLTDGNPLFLEEMLRQLRRADQRCRRRARAAEPRPARSDPRARGPARLAAARRRDLPPAGRRGRRSRSARPASSPRRPP